MKRRVEFYVLSVHHTDLHWVNDSKNRKQTFLEILSRRNERELLQLASCLYLKSQETSKGLSSSDMQILKRNLDIQILMDAINKTLEDKDAAKQSA